MKIFAAMITLLLLYCPVAYAAERDVLENLIARSVAAYEKLDAYTCLFDMHERLENGKMKKDQNILLKFSKPGRISLEWTEGDNKGMRIEYDHKKNAKDMIVHLGGSFDFMGMPLDPHGWPAMRNNRHPITEAGIGFILETIVKSYERARTDHASRIEYEGMLLLSDNIRVHAAKGVFPAGKGYYGREVTVHFHAEYELPVYIRVIGWEGELLEEYRFRNLVLNTPQSPEALH